MPSFYRKTTISNNKAGLSRRKFVRHPKEEVVVKKPIIKNETIKLIENVAHADVEDKQIQNKYIEKSVDKTMSTLDSLLDVKKQQEEVIEQPKEEVKDDNAVYRENDITEFNGISDGSEQNELLEEVVSYERKKAKTVEEQLKMTVAEHEAERRSLEKEIRTLKQELHRTTPIHDNKFFSLSKQLREAIQEIERIASDSGVDTSMVLPVSAAASDNSTQQIVLPSVKTVAKPVQPVVEEKVAIENDSGPVEQKKLSKNKTLITGAVAIIALCLMGTLVTKFLITKPKVDDKLVAQYLPKTDGQVQGAQTNNVQSEENKQETPSDPSQSDVTFEQSTWGDFNDSAFGIMVQYPNNAVKPIRTESNITFIRKTGYLFKVQRIETALTIEEYWKQIKATSLNFSVKEDKFKGKNCLKLTLEDIVDYPGDRILVKEGNFIYDIWYATSSKNFTADDIKRAEKMLASISVVGVK